MRILRLERLRHELRQSESAHGSISPLGRAMFDDMDRNHDGVVDIIEFQQGMEMFAERKGKTYSNETLRAMFMEADRNGDGVIDYDEWMDMQKLQKALRSTGLSSRRTRAISSDTDAAGEVTLEQVEAPLDGHTVPPEVAAVTSKAMLRKLLTTLSEPSVGGTIDARALRGPNHRAPAHHAAHCASTAVWLSAARSRLPERPQRRSPARVPRVRRRSSRRRPGGSSTRRSIASMGAMRTMRSMACLRPRTHAIRSSAIGQSS